MDPIAGFAVSSGADKELELVLCVNQVVRFKSLSGADSRSFEVKWTAHPSGVGM